MSYAGNWNRPAPLARPVDPFPVNKVLVKEQPTTKPAPQETSK